MPARPAGGHENPCRDKWNLVTDVTKYLHSSARFYLCGEQGVYPIMSYLELDDIDLTKTFPVDAWSMAMHKSGVRLGCEVRMQNS